MNLIYRNINQRFQNLNKNSFTTDRVFLKRNTYPYRYEEISEETWNDIKSGDNTDYFVYDSDKLIYIKFTEEKAEQLIEQTTPKYTVRFYDVNDNLIKSVLVMEDNNYVFDGTTPTKNSTAQYSYTFSGWSTTKNGTVDSSALTSISEDKDLYAIFEAILRSYDVKFYNGTELLQTVSCNYGSTPIYTGSTPTKESDDDYDYTFDGWVPELSSISGETSYNAYFTSSERVTEIKQRIGGRIYYINPDVTGDYKFYKEDGTEITGWTTIADLADAYEYVKLGENTEDKFYVFNNDLATSKRWTYYVDGNYKYEQIFTTPSATYAVGQGRNNTLTVMAKDSGAYVTDNSNGKATIWYTCSQINSSNTGGCNDWFVPSQNELDALRTSGLVNWFSSNYIWSSSEYSYCDARLWNSNRSNFNDLIKYDNNCCVCVRAF